LSPKRIGQVIKQIRTAKGLTQAELATRAKVTKNYITMLERGKGEPSIKVLRRLAKALEVPAGMLLGE
jgi:transcriptional regulator with XRE-family HTH domain